MKLRRRKVYMTLAFTGLVASTSALVTLRLGRPLYYSDGQQAVSGMQLRYSTMLEWGAPAAEVELPGPVRGRVARLPDGRLLYGLAKGERRTDLVLFDPDKPGLEPEPVLGLNTAGHELAPAVTAVAGTSATVFFASDRKGGAGGFDPYRARYRSGVFYSVQALPKTINSHEDETDPAPHPGGDQFVFVRRNPHRFDGRNGTLMIVSLSGTEAARPLFEDPNVSASVETPLDRDPAFTADGIGLWFVRQRVGEPTAVVRTFLHQDHFVDPLPVRALAKGGPFRAPAPGPGDASLWLLQPSRTVPGGGPTTARLWRSDAYEVYPWWEGQRWLERLLLSLMLFFALLTLLLTLGGRWQQLDLITKLLLLSMLLHLLLLLWFSRLEIVRRFKPEPPREGRIEVQLLSGRSESGVTANGAVAQANFDVSRDVSFHERQEALTASAPGSELAASARDLKGPEATERAERSASQSDPVVSARDVARDVAMRDARSVTTQLMARRVVTSENSDDKFVPKRNAGSVERFSVTVPGSQFPAGAAVASSRYQPAQSTRSQPVATAKAEQSVTVSDSVASASTYAGRSTAAKLDASAPTLTEAQVAPKARRTEHGERSVHAAPTDTSTLASTAGRADAAAEDLRTARAAPSETNGPEVLADVSDGVAAPAVHATEARTAGIAATELPATVQKAAGADTAARSESRSDSLQATGPKQMLALPQPVTVPATARELPSRAEPTTPMQSLVDPLREGTEVVASRAATGSAVPIAAAKVDAVHRIESTVVPGQRSEPSTSAEIVTKGPESLLARGATDVATDISREVPKPHTLTAEPAIADTVDPNDVAAAEQVRTGAAAAAGDRATELDALSERDAGAATAKRSTQDVAQPRSVPVPATMLSAAADPTLVPTTARPNGWTHEPVEVAPGMATLADGLSDTPAPEPSRATTNATTNGVGAAVLAAVSGPEVSSFEPDATRRFVRGDRTPARGIRVPGSFLERAGIGAPSREAIASRPTNVYQNRFGAEKVAALKRYGGTQETERAVAKGLAYLARIQTRDGSWGDKGRTQDKYGEVFVGKTGLCLLAFLGAGHTHKSNTKYSDVARKAIDFLLFAQDAKTGHFGMTSAYSHGITTYALAECYAMTKDPDLRPALEDAVEWILANQKLTRDRRNRGGWGYFSPTLRPEDHYARASTSSWQVMALESAKIGGITVPRRSMEMARDFFNQLFDRRHGYFLYTREPSRLRMDWRTLPASTPASVFCLLLLGGDADDARIQTALDFTVDRKPRAFRRASEDAFVTQGAGHTYFWYYGSLACFLAGGDAWDEWNAQLKRVLPAAQSRDGSWRPIDPYAEYAGDTNRDRSYTTAMCVLSLEVYYRYFTPLLKKR